MSYYTKKAPEIWSIETIEQNIDPALLFSALLEWEAFTTEVDGLEKHDALEDFEEFLQRAATHTGVLNTELFDVLTRWGCAQLLALNFSISRRWLVHLASESIGAGIENEESSPSETVSVFQLLRSRNFDFPEFLGLKIKKYLKELADSPEGHYSNIRLAHEFAYISSSAVLPEEWMTGLVESYLPRSPYEHMIFTSAISPSDVLTLLFEHPSSDSRLWKLALKRAIAGKDFSFALDLMETASLRRRRLVSKEEISSILRSGVASIRVRAFKCLGLSGFEELKLSQV